MSTFESKSTEPNARARRQAWPFVRKRVYASGAIAWSVDARTKNGGERKAFATKVEAESFAQAQRIKRQNEGIQSIVLTAAERVDADAALQILRPLNRSLREAAEFFASHLKAIREVKSVSETISELLESKRSDGASSRYLKDLRTRLNIFARDFGSLPIAEIDTPAIDDWLRALPHGPVTRNNYRRLLGVLFGYAVQRRYAQRNPAGDASRAKQIDAPPGVLTPKQARRLLDGADGEIVPAIALGLFAGLRPESEIWRLDWKCIDLDAGLIDIAAEKTKTAQRRFVKIGKNLRAWLQPYAKPSGAVSPKHDRYFDLLKKARAKATLDAVEEGKHEEGIAVWPSDCMRHTFASMHLAHFKNAGETAQELGHADLKMLYRHYRERVKPLDASEFWKIFPLPVSAQPS